MPGRAPWRIADESPSLDLAELRVVDGWCLGWACYRVGSTRWLGHDGTTDGTTCNLRFDPTTGTTVALMTNATSGLLLWRDLVVVPAAASTAVVPPAGCVGEYHNGEMRWTVDQPDGNLVVEDETGARERLLMLDDSAFVTHRIDVDDAPALGRFLCDPAGRIDCLQLSGRLYRREPDESVQHGAGR